MSLGVVLVGLLSIIGCQRTGQQAEGRAPVAADQKEIESLVATLTPDKQIERSISPGEQHVYELNVESDNFVEIEVEQQGVDVVARLLDPNGELLMEMDLPIADLGPERLMVVVESGGNLRLEVEAWGSENSEGTYRASYFSRRATDVDHMRARAAAVFSQAEQLAWSRKFEAALELYEEALELWRQAGDEFWQAETLDRMGDAHWERRQWRRSVEAHEEAARRFRDLGEVRFEAISHNDLASAYWNLAELDRAFQHHSRALELREQVGDRRGMAIALQGLAEIYKVQGETQKALDRFVRSLELSDQPEDRRYRATALHNLGTLYHMSGKHEIAMGHLRSAEKIFAELDKLRQASSLSQIGQLAFEMGEHQAALRALNEALVLRREVEDKRGEAVALRRIGSVLQAVGNSDEAHRHYLEALQLLRNLESPRATASVLARLGDLYRETDRLDEAIGPQREALSLFERVGDAVGQAESLLGLAISERRRGDLKTALETGRRALAIAENLRTKPLSEDLRFSFFSTVQSFFEFYIDLLMELDREVPGRGYAAMALQVSERARARSLLDLLSEAGAEIRDDTAPELLETERELQRRLNGASATLMSDQSAVETRRSEAMAAVHQLRSDLDAVRAEIRRRSPQYAALTQPQPFDLGNIQQQVLDEDTVLLEYKLGQERSFVWLVEKDTVSAFELRPARDIERSVRQLYGLISQSPRLESEPRIERLLCDLSRDLLAPIAGRLSQKRLAIVAEGALQFISFAALPDPSSPEECTRAPPLVETHEIVYLPSASTLGILRREAKHRRTASGLVAVLADPVFAMDDERVSKDERVEGIARVKDAEPVETTRALVWPATSKRFRRLPRSREEAKTILDLVPEELRYQALDFDASKETIVSGRLSDYRIVHFATHGLMDAQQPELSGVILSLVDRHGQPVDGILRAHEIYNLRLAADLVVLGACETALGKDVKGEGLIGMARGFMYAGASRVMVSLWRVSDRSTSKLMAAFYRAMLVDQLAPAAALRAAQLTVREEHPQPFYWAGFVLQGDWSPGGEFINKPRPRGS